MKNFKIHLTCSYEPDPSKKTLCIDCKCRGQIISKVDIERQLKENRRDINAWLCFGDAHIDVTDGDTGEIIADGVYEFNAFSGQWKYSLNIFAQ